jgi:hypothetical protein
MTSSATAAISPPPSSGGAPVFFPAWRGDVMRQLNVRDALQRRSFIDLVRQRTQPPFHLFHSDRVMSFSLQNSAHLVPFS